MVETHRLYGRMLVHTRDGYTPGPYFVLPPDRTFNGGIGHRLMDAYTGRPGMFVLVRKNCAEFITEDGSPLLAGDVV